MSDEDIGLLDVDAAQHVGIRRCHRWGPRHSVAEVLGERPRGHVGELDAPGPAIRHRGHRTSTHAPTASPRRSPTFSAVMPTRALERPIVPRLRRLPLLPTFHCRRPQGAGGLELTCPRAAATSTRPRRGRSPIVSQMACDAVTDQSVGFGVSALRGKATYINNTLTLAMSKHPATASGTQRVGLLSFLSEPRMLRRNTYAIAAARMRMIEPRPFTITPPVQQDVWRLLYRQQPRYMC